ncbi:MAG: penicillin-binding transpeptidase domain-containing protein [Candidatus Omnitrophota bacterium]
MLKIRRYFVVFLFMSLFFFLFLRLFCLQITDKDKFEGLAGKQHSSVLKIEPKRGAIFDDHMDPLAINLDAPSVYCNAREITDPGRTAKELSEILGIDEEIILDKVTRNKAFVWIKRKVEEKTAQEVMSRQLKGIYIVGESKRNYPSGKIASHIIGVAGTDNTGLEGLELLYNNKLKGEPGEKRLLRDAKRRTVFFNKEGSIPPKNGSNIILTIDSVIQFIAEEELSVMAEKYTPESASVIVIDPETGKILAMANYPDYDLNDSRNALKENMKNCAVTDMYEPGSVFKIITAGAALNENVIGLDDKIYCENGNYKVGGRVLHDYHKYGELTFRDVIVKSSNIGTVKVAQKLGKNKLYDYIKKFGFGERTGIGLPGEVSGINRPSGIWSKSDITTIPMGQGIAVTSIQMVSAINTIANGGYLMRPYIVDKIITWEGDIDTEIRPEVKRKVLNPETCDKMREILKKVITDGTGKRARSKKYEFCGKTGTAQMVDPSGGYYDNKYYATFVGFAPADDPVVSIVVVVRDPKKAHFGGTVSAPVFKNIAERVLQYMGLDRKRTGISPTEG